VARINLEISRRLEPLLEGDRRRIELLNGMLMSLPGSPVLYYGDEIGMGDNLRLGDRNGVRTPMQWTGGPSGGFSTADPEQLYLPIISNPAFGFAAVNVESQQHHPHSLLNWTRRQLMGVGQVLSERDDAAAHPRCRFHRRHSATGEVRCHGRSGAASLPTLRTTHRVSVSSSGSPSGDTGVRTVFAAADLLQARAVVVVDPDVTSISPDWVEALAGPLLREFASSRTWEGIQAVASPNGDVLQFADSLRSSSSTNASDRISWIAGAAPASHKAKQQGPDGRRSRQALLL
jgi:hypothetical protein